MLAVVKTPHTKITLEGDIPKPILKVIEGFFGKKLKVSNESEDELIDLFQTDCYLDIKKKMTPGKSLRNYRKNRGMTQEKIGEKCGGLSRQYISDLEHGRRAMSKNLAKSFASFFGTSVEKFI